MPTSDNTTVPVQIKLPQLLTTSSPDGTTNTVVLQQSMNQQNITTVDCNNQNQSTLDNSSQMIPWHKITSNRKYVKRKNAKENFKIVKTTWKTKYLNE